ncbi:hypothetical protein Sps_03438 [Shewanella psychrophila]|uniref:Uncharacterized protein n=1 Tax=Shewanella psychrophila TaxID=225848 RepID=A0A1S6HSR8_9GAMM|nr:hypothetical protein [Shewanella psychrophila]AQS38565.1 hypothetical protein Sps_03438 [Shewanella psychrophila]
MDLLKDRQKSTYEWFKKRIFELKKEAQSSGGRIVREDIWRCEYYRNPYLLLEEDETIQERLADVFTNSLDIGANGKISVTPMIDNDARFGRLLIELIEETNWRGILKEGSIGYASEQLNAYYSNGMPLGVKMFDKLTIEPENCLLKFSKKQYVEDMLKYGRFRISPASYYSKGSHIKAIKDLETVRSYRLKAISEILKGESHFEFQGLRNPIINGVVPIEFVMGDYYMFCTCNEVSRRMPTDFESDAVLIIKDKVEFINRLKDELLISFPDWEFLESDVYYYDPYNDTIKDKDQEFYKHFSYAYQKEHRCIIRPKVKNSAAVNLDAFSIEIGSISDIAEVIIV